VSLVPGPGLLLVANAKENIMKRRTFGAFASLGAAAVAAGALPGPASAQLLPPQNPHRKDAYTWKTTAVNSGGFTTGIHFNETEPGLVYARTDVAGCFRWDEDNRRWKQLLDWVPREKWGYQYVVSLATDPVETNRVYAAVGAYTISWDENNGAVLYSDDKGETWGVAELPFKQGGNMPGRGMGERLAVNPANNAELYLGTPSGNGLWRSTDYGRTWAEVESFPNPGNFVMNPDVEYLSDNVGVVWIDFDQINGDIYVGVADPDDPLYVSKDSGATWQPVPGAAEALGEVDGNRTIPKQSAVDNTNGYLYIVTSHDPGPYNGAPSSGNGGQIWRLSTLTGEWTDITPTYNPRGVIPGFGGLTIDRQNPGTIMAASCNNWYPDETLYRSTDSGETWTHSWEYVQAGVSRTDRFVMDHSGSPWLDWGGQDQGPVYAVKHGWMIDALSIDPHNSDRIMWGTGATVWGTEELTQWDTQGDLVGEDEDGENVALPVDQFTVGVRAEGIEMTWVRDLMVPSGGVIVAAMGDVGGFVWDNNYDEAQKMIRNDWTGTSCDFAPSNPDLLVAAGDIGNNTEFGHVIVSTDGGKTWQDGPRNTEVTGNGGGVVAITADGSTILWSPRNTQVTPMYSTDLGQTWTPVEGLPVAARIRPDRVDPSVLYAFSRGTFYRSTDAGRTFTDTGATGLPTEGVDDFRTVPGRKGHVWIPGRTNKADIPKGMWHSRDCGLTWRRIDGIDEATGVGFGKAPRRGGYPTVYISAKIDGKHGIYRSVNGGAHWVRINDDDNQWGFAGAYISGDPEIYGRVYLSARGVVYGDIA
jgi:photosystem II stability/assembly factor-like uncharacterized protein